MGEQYDSYEQGKGKKGMKKAKKERAGFNRDNPHKSGRGMGKKGSVQDTTISQASRIRYWFIKSLAFFEFVSILTYIPDRMDVVNL